LKAVVASLKAVAMVVLNNATTVAVLKAANTQALSLAETSVLKTVALQAVVPVTLNAAKLVQAHAHLSINMAVLARLVNRLVVALTPKNAHLSHVAFVKPL
jgi:hypothetical protein